MILTAQDLCHEALVGLLTRPGGEGLTLSTDSPDPLRPLIHIELTLQGGGPIRGRVVGLQGITTTSPYDISCTSGDCLDGAGIWTRVAPIVVERPDYPYDTYCVDRECMQPYEPTCLVEYISLESTCTVEEAADCDAWGREYVRGYRIEPLVDCGAPPIEIPLTDCERGLCTEQWVGTDWCRVYDLHAGVPFMPVDTDCYDSDCIEGCPPVQGKVALCWGGPFEDGVVDKECYIEGYHMLLYDSRMECLDECVVSPWLPLQWRDCEGNVYPFTDPHRDNLWVPGIHVLGDLTIKVEAGGCTDDCISDSSNSEGNAGYNNELVVSVYSPPYSDECVDADCMREYVPVATGSWGLDGGWCIEAIESERIPYQYNSFIPMGCIDTEGGQDCVDRECFIDGIHTLVDGYLGDCRIDILQYLRDSAPMPCVRQGVDMYGLWGGFEWPTCTNTQRPQEVVLSRSCIECEEQVADGFTYRRSGEGVEFYVRGASNGTAVYVVDIGYLHPVCYEPMWVETWLPVYEDGRFEGTHTLPPGVIPFLRVREVTYSRDRVVLHHIEYGRPTLGRIRTKALLYHNSTDSAVDVEELAMTLIAVMLAPCRVSAPCQVVQGEGPDPYLTPLVLDNLLLLASLLDDGSVLLPGSSTSKDACGITSITPTTTNTEATTGRLGSIPAVLTTYATHDLVYNDALYNQVPEYPLEAGILTNSCMSQFWDDVLWIDDHTLDRYDCTGECLDAWDMKELLPSREVSNRAVAWVLLAMSTWRHAMGSHSVIDRAIGQLTGYLLGEVQGTGLLRQGWSHSNTYRDSLPISTITTSTTLVAYMSLMKVYDLYRSSAVLSSLVRMHEGLMSHLWDANRGAFLHGVGPTPHISLDSILHGIWFGHTMQRSEMVEGGLLLLQARTRPLGAMSAVPLWDVRSSGGCVLIGSPEGGEVTCETLPVYHEITRNLEVIKRITRCGVRYTDPYTGAVMVGDIGKEGYLRMLLDGLSTVASANQYQVPYLPLLDDYRTLWVEHLMNHRYGVPSYCYADCLYHCPGATPRTFFLHDLFQVYANHEVDVCIFHKGFLRSKLPFSVPVDYEWPSLEALAGKVGLVLDGWAHELAIVYGSMLRARRGVSLSQAVGSQLDEYWPLAKRYAMESDNTLRGRIRGRLSRDINSTKVGLLALVRGVIREPRILGLQSLSVDTRFPPAGGRYHGAGGSIHPAFTLEADVVLSGEVVQTLGEAKAYGVLDSYRGQVLLECSQSDLSMALSVTLGGVPKVYVTYPCCHELDPCRRVRVDLHLNGLYPYPLYVGLGEDGVWFVSRGHTPRTRWMFRPWQLSMEVVVPIGYV